MRSLKNDMPVRDQRRFQLSWLAPQQKDNRLISLAERSDHTVGEIFPTMLAMRVRFTFPNRQHRVQQQNSLLRPRFKVSMCRRIGGKIRLKFLENVLQRRRQSTFLTHGKTQTVSLIGAVVRILPKDHSFHVPVVGPTKRVKDIVDRWIDRVRLTFLFNKLLQRYKVRRLKTLALTVKSNLNRSASRVDMNILTFDSIPCEFDTRNCARWASRLSGRSARLTASSKAIKRSPLRLR